MSSSSSALPIYATHLRPARQDLVCAALDARSISCEASTSGQLDALPCALVRGKTHQNVVELLPLDLAELVGVERPHKLARLDQSIPSEQLNQVGRALVAPVRERRRDRDAARRAKVEDLVLLDADGRETSQARDHHVDGNVFAILAHVDVSVDLWREDTCVGVEAVKRARRVSSAPCQAASVDKYAQVGVHHHGLREDNCVKGDRTRVSGTSPRESHGAVTHCCTCGTRQPSCRRSCRPA